MSEMADRKSLHSIYRWTFYAGKGGSVPAAIRPDWNEENLPTAENYLSLLSMNILLTGLHDDQVRVTSTFPFFGG